MSNRYDASTGGFTPMSDMDLPAYDADGEVIFPNNNPSQQSPRKPENNTPPPPQREQRPPQRPRPSGNPQRPQGAPQPAQPPHALTKPGVTKRLFADGRASMFCGIVLLVGALFLLISVIGYFTSGEADQSMVTGRTLSELAADKGAVKNSAGPLGAFLSHFLVSQGLGLASFVVIFYLTALGLSFLKVWRFKFWDLTSKCLLATIAVSVVLGLITYNSGESLYWGGVHGHYINTILIDYSGVVGAICISVILVALMLLLFLPGLHKAWKFVSTLIAKRTERIRNQRAQAKLRKEERQRQRAEQEAYEAAQAQAQAAAEAQAQAAAEADSYDNYNANDTFVAAEPEEPITQPEAQQEQPDTVAGTRLDFAEQAPEATETVSAEAIEDISDAPQAPLTDITDVQTNEVSETNEISETVEIIEEIIPEEVNEPEFVVAAGEAISEVRNISNKPYDPTADLPKFRLPSIDCLVDRPIKQNCVDLVEQTENKERIIKTLGDYGIGIQSINATVGPTVTLYEIVPAEGVRIAKIKRLEDDIALSLAALGIRIIAPIPGRGTIGIEVPNKDPQTVSMRSIIASEEFQKSDMELPMAMGTTIDGQVFMADLCKMPHLLVAGATGMGKSVGLNAIIASLLYKKHPAELKFVLIDPKMVEFSLYSRLEKHYLAKLPEEEDAIITDPSRVVTTLKSLCVEMDQRYALLKDANLRNIKEYNQRFIERKLNPNDGHHYLPYIVVIVDEFADLIMTAGKEVETPIARIAQKARAVGMHMILATQRPSTNVITGLIKANFPGRVAFRVTQMVDSRTILDRPGANQLIGRGDMLFSRDGEISRVQCAFIDTPEVDAICEEIHGQVGYEHAFFLPECLPEETETISGGANFGERDPLFEEAARLVVSTGLASTSSLQRRYSIGYNRAGKIMDQMEAAGIVGPAQGGKPRSVLTDIVTLESILEG